MLRSMLVGWGALLLSIGAVVTIAAATRQRTGWVKGVLVTALVLLATHPGLWVGASSGDCGQLRFLASITVAVLHVVLTVPVVLGARRG